jgi:hypothetical protein
MQTRSQALADDRPCPLAFVVTATFASSLVWLWAILGQAALR